MRAATTPTRRTMKQQTLAAAMSAAASPVAVTPARAGGATTDDGKRMTRAQSTPTKVPIPHVNATTNSTTTATTTTAATTTTSARTPSPPRTRARPSPSPALRMVRTPQLRPRRTPTSFVGLRDPYEQHAVDALREECVRRGLPIGPREQEGGKGAVRGKAQFIELLQQADMLAMFERQSQKKTGRRSARAVKLTPPPVPIRVTSVAVSSSRSGASSKNVAAVGASPASSSASPRSSSSAATLLPASAATSLPQPAVATGKKAASKASAAKKPIRPPPKRKTAQPSAKAVAASTPVQPMIPSAQDTSNNSLSTPAPWLAAAQVVQPKTDQASATEESEQVADVPAAPQPLILPANTVDLTGDETHMVPEVQAAMPLVTSDQSVQNQPTVAIASVPRAAPVPSAPQHTESPTLSAAVRPTTTPAVRARRGCRFRLINVVLSPDFNTRWSEMSVPVKSRVELNTFWRDVHISFLCQNSFYDKVHFEDALFESVTPNVIQNHTAQKLQQMWTEIVSTYRRAHTASIKSEEPKPFLDFCAGRLDLLYLHMALLLEPELHRLVLSEIPRSKVSLAAPKTSNNAPARPSVTKQATANHEIAAATGDEPQLAVSNASANPERGPRFVELQNPEMLPDWLLEDQAKTAAERGLLVDFEAPPTQGQATTQPGAAPKMALKAKKQVTSKSKKAPVMPKRTPDISSVPDNSSPVQTRDMVLHSSAINSIDDSASSDYETAEPDFPADEVTRRRAPGKRRRAPSSSELPSSELVEVPSSRELVPHPHKRMHTAVTTTMTRSQEVVLPPDEFDVQHNRLRKINESIDQCYRTLSNRDAILNDMHREDVESDLRFYLGIKKRIQEQIVMFMHGF